MGEPPVKAPENDKMKDLKSRYEINLLSSWRIIWKRRKMIGQIMLVITILTIVVSLFMTNIYQARAVITPVAPKDSSGTGLSSILSQQLGEMPGLSGIRGATNAEEIVNLLGSNILREKVITRYNLLPVLFYEDWNAEKKCWKASEAGSILNPITWFSKLVSFMTPSPPNYIGKKEPGIPDVWDGIRELNDLVKVNYNKKQNSIIVTGNFRDPEIAAKLVEYFLAALTDHMSSEARRVALTNMKYLESQLGATTDPFIKQRIFSLIAQQLENSMMAEVKENFAFKIIDPPKAPDRKIKPKRVQMVLIALVASLFLGLFMAFFLEYLEKQNIKINIDISKTNLLLDRWRRRKQR